MTCGYAHVMQFPPLTAIHAFAPVSCDPWEIYEDTGLTIEPCPLTGVYQKMVRHIVALVFRSRPVTGQLVENDEVTAFRWASRSEIPDLMTEAYATRILDGLGSGGQPIVRAHDGSSLLPR